MQIQINTDKNEILDKDQMASSTCLISEDLSRFSTQITRLEIHLSDEDSNKDGSNDKRCLIKARPCRHEANCCY